MKRNYRKIIKAAKQGFETFADCNVSHSAVPITATQLSQANNSPLPTEILRDSHLHKDVNGDIYLAYVRAPFSPKALADAFEAIRMNYFSKLTSSLTHYRDDDV